MRKELTDIYGPEIFKPLASNNRDVYWYVLKTLYNACENESFDMIEKEEAVSIIQKYFESHSTDLFNDDIDEDDVKSDPKSKAHSVLRRLKKYKWIEEDTGRDYKINIIIPGHLMRLIQLYLMAEQNVEIEYSSNIFTIYKLLENPKPDQGIYVNLLNNVKEQTNILFNGLKTLKSNIGQYVDSISEGKSPAEIIEMYTLYDKAIGSAAYYRLKSNDNVLRYRNTILEGLRYLYNPEIYESLINDCMEYEKITNKADADIFLRGIIGDLIYRFDSYEFVIREIDGQNNKVIQCAIQRCKFLLSTGDNLEGRINNLLQLLVEIMDKTENPYTEELPDLLAEIILLEKQELISNESFATPRITRKILSSESVPEIKEANQQDVFRVKEEFAKRCGQYAERKQLNKRILKRLNEQGEFKLSDLNTQFDKDFMSNTIKTVLGGAVTESDFKLEYTGEKTRNNGYIFDEAIIKKAK